MNSSDGGEEGDRRMGFVVEMTSGSAAGEWRRSIRVVETDDRAIVAGLRDGPGAAEVVCVCERADRDLSKNSRIVFGSVIALYLLSMSGDNVFSRGTTRVGRLAGGKALHAWTYSGHEGDLPVMLSRKYSGE